MIDLSTTYLGLRLRNPLVVSASPLTHELTNVGAMEDMQAGAIVFHSLFEEQIEIEERALDKGLSQGTERFAESVTYFPRVDHPESLAEQYVKHFERAKELVDIPLIASLNGISKGGWIRYARVLQDAGADALELNLYHIASDVSHACVDVEKQLVDLVQAVRESVRIPIAVKVGHSFTAFANFAAHLDETGVHGLVVFNRFYQPDFNLEMLEAKPQLTLSNSSELLLRLHWVGALYGQIKADLAITGGVHTVDDVLKSMMAGARVAMMTSALLENGIEHLARVRDELIRWMQEHEYESIAQMQGSMSRKHVANPEVYERGNYMRVLSSYVLYPPRRTIAVDG